LLTADFAVHLAGDPGVSRTSSMVEPTFLLNGKSSVENLEDQLRALISALRDGAT
jgi:hypothetical protein